MLIAKKLRKQNLVAYVLYMYQVEDIIRSYDCDIQKIAEEYLHFWLNKSVHLT